MLDLKERLKNRILMARLLAVGGGLAGLVGVLVAVSITGLDFVPVIRDENIEVPRTLVGLAWALVGVFGGIMSWKNNRVPALFMLVAGVAGIITIPEYFAVGGALLLIAAVITMTNKSSSAES